MKPSAPPQTYRVKSFGCQMNVYDGERMGELLAERGIMPAPEGEDADLVILNTCHIREKAAEKVYSDIGRLVAFFQQVDAVVAAAPAVAGKDVPVVEPDSRADPARSGPRQRATTLAPTSSPAGRSTGGFRQPRPADKAPARTTTGTVRPGGDAAGTRPGPAAPPAARPAAEPDAASQDVESPAVLLARIRAAEAAVLDTAQRLLDTR